MKSPLIRGLAISLLLPPALAQSPDSNWLDRQHAHIQGKLQHWANDLDRLIDTPDLNNPASANLRIMWDHEWNRHNGYTTKPRIRAKLRLPALKRKFSLVLGDDDLDNQSRDKHQLHRNYNQPLEHDQKYDRRQTRRDNTSIALRWSDRIKQLGIDTDLDLGLRRSTDIFLRAKASKTWQWNDRFHSRIEQIYRFGLHSRHYIRTNLEHQWRENDQRSLNNHTYYQYTHSTDQKKHWGNSTYRQHHYAHFKQLNYGFNFGGEVKDKQAKLHFYGPFINWRQPIFRPWLFIQPELHFYNHKAEKRPHRLGAFLRIEALF